MVTVPVCMVAVQYVIPVPYTERRPTYAASRYCMERIFQQRVVLTQRKVQGKCLRILRNDTESF